MTNIIPQYLVLSVFVFVLLNPPLSPGRSSSSPSSVVSSGAINSNLDLEMSEPLLQLSFPHAPLRSLQHSWFLLGRTLPGRVSLLISQRSESARPSSHPALKIRNTINMPQLTPSSAPLTRPSYLWTEKTDNSPWQAEDDDPAMPHPLEATA